jgi:cystathionine beta-lyase
MRYNFDHTLDHRANHSYRWTQLEGRNDIIGMGTADMDFACPPCIRQTAQQICSENTFNYRAKPDHYYNSLTGWYRRRYGLEISRDWLTNIPATLGAIRFLIGHFAKAGDRVIMQTPHFSPLQRAIEASGCELILNPLHLTDGRYELDLEDFEQKIKEHRPAMYILVNPHNPTGRVFTQEELDRMISICYENHVLVLSDEVHCLITYGEENHIPLLALSDKARSIGIQVMAMSKGFNTMGLPHAIIMIADPKMQKSWTDYILPFDFYYASNAYALSAFTAITDGLADDWLADVTGYLEGNLDLFCREVLRRNLPIRPLRPEAGYLLWIDCRDSGLDQDHLADAFLAKAGISLADGLEFGEAGRGFVRMNFAVTRETLLAVIDRLERMFLY